MLTLYSLERFFIRRCRMQTLRLRPDDVDAQAELAWLRNRRTRRCGYISEGRQ